MKESISGLFHCGRCGNFFKAEVGVVAIRRCPDCGCDPTVAIDDRKLRKVTSEAGVVRDLPANPEAAESGEEAEASGRRRATRRRRQSNPALRRVVMLLAAWVLMLGVFAVLMTAWRVRREREEAERAAFYKATRQSDSDPLAISADPRHRAFLEDNFPDCSRVLAGYLASSLPEERCRWVFGGLEMVGVLARFDQMNMPNLPETMRQHEYVGVINTGSGPLIEALWRAPDDRRIETIFRRDTDGWRLDWESFVRYSETPWVMFLAGGGAPVQEYRLLARERLAGERQLQPDLSVVFHPPRFGNPGEAGPASPEFSVPRLSDPGRALGALFDLNRRGEAPFGAKVPSQDPAGMIRVRVRVSRSDDEGIGRRFKIDEVLAGHWLGIDESGIPAPDEPNPLPPAEAHEGRDRPPGGP